MSRAPRVLVAGAVLGQPMGGVRRHNAELLPRVAARLRDDGGALDVLAPRDGLAFDPGPLVRVIPSDVPAGPPARRAWSERRAFRRLLAEARARGEPYDVLHSAHLPAPVVPGVARTITIHDLRSVRLAQAGLVRRALGRPLLTRALRRANLVVTVSRAVRDDLLELFGGEIAPDDVRVVPNAADHLEVRPRRDAPDAPLLHVGHLEPRKNLGLLFDALALDPGLPRLVLVGGERRLDVRELARRAGVLERVELAGEVDDRELAERYASAGCVVLPSLLEGFGIPALEALRAGVPLAVSREGALEEVTGGFATSFPADDPQACARAIRAALATSREDRERAREHAASFTWDRSAELLTTILRDAALRDAPSR